MSKADTTSAFELAHSTEEVMEALDRSTSSAALSAKADAIAQFGSMLAGHESEERVQYCQRENLNPDDPEYSHLYAYHYSQTWDSLHSMITF